MASLLEDLEQFLISKSIGTADGVDLFRDAVPDSPDSVIVLSEYGSAPMSFGDQSVSRSIQVITRATTYAEAQTKAWQIFKAFIDPLQQIQTITPDRWGIFYGRQTPNKLQVDEHARVLFFFNLGITTTMD